MSLASRAMRRWIVYIIRADCGFTYVGESCQFGKRLARHRAGSPRCPSIRAKDTKTYQELHTWEDLSYFTAKKLERVVKRHIKEFGVESAIRSLTDVGKATAREWIKPVDRRIAAKYGYSDQECTQTTSVNSRAITRRELLAQKYEEMTYGILEAK